jgi:hypothetical protein
MTSDRQIAANRRNAKKSTGPRSEAGRRKSSYNAIRHGLATDITSDPAFQEGLEQMTKLFSQDSAEENLALASSDAAEAELQLLRIRRFRASIFGGFNKGAKRIEDIYKLNVALARLHRYERRTFSKRKRAMAKADLAKRTHFVQMPLESSLSRSLDSEIGS